MQSILSTLFSYVAAFHNWILSWNDQSQYNFTDKELHFIVIGAVGIILIFICYPLFKWLASRNHTMVIAFLYVFTVVVVITFAIEIGQGITGTGAMEFDDIVYGVAGFLLCFVVFCVFRAIYHFIRRLIESRNDDAYYG